MGATAAVGTVVQGTADPDAPTGGAAELDAIPVVVSAAIRG